MFGLSLWHWLIVLGVVVLLLGGARASGVLENVGRGLGSFWKGVAEGSARKEKDD